MTKFTSRGCNKLELALKRKAIFGNNFGPRLIIDDLSKLLDILQIIITNDLWYMPACNIHLHQQFSPRALFKLSHGLLRVYSRIPIHCSGMGNIFDYGDAEEVNIREFRILDSSLNLEALKKAKRLTLEGD